MADTTTTAPAAGADPGQSGIESTDDIVGDLLAQKAEGNDGADEPEAQADPEEAHDPEASTEEDDEPADDDDAAPVEGDLPQVLVDARAALEEGDLDKAFELAFGKKPEQVQPDNKAWTKWRAANAKERGAVAKERATLKNDTAQAQQWFATERQKINATIEQLKPYEAQHDAAVAFRRDGDPSHLVKVIELASGMSYDEAQKIILTKQRRSPGERHLAQQMAELQRKLEEATAVKQQQETQLSQQQVYANDLQTIRQQAASVAEVAKVPRYAERIYKVLTDTRTPTGLAMTVAEAAKRVVASERRRLAKHPLLKSAAKNPVSQAASTLAKARKKPVPGAPLRRDSQNNGAKDTAAIESTDDIVADLLKGKRRAG